MAIAGTDVGWVYTIRVWSRWVSFGLDFVPKIGARSEYNNCFVAHGQRLTRT